jgi:hypothetical protein
VATKTGVEFVKTEQSRAVGPLHESIDTESRRRIGGNVASRFRSASDWKPGSWAKAMPDAPANGVVRPNFLARAVFFGLMEVVCKNSLCRCGDESASEERIVYGAYLGVTVCPSSLVPR